MFGLSYSGFVSILQDSQLKTMELPDLVLRDPKKSADIKRILSGLILSEATLERVREVFKREIKLGLQFGLEKVDISTSKGLLTG